MKYSIGIDVGGTKIAYGLFDQDHKMIAKHITKSMPELAPNDMMDNMCHSVTDFINQNNLTINDIKGVGVVFPGHSYFDKGIIISASNLPNFKNTPARDYLSQKLSLPVVFDNDANAAAIAEHTLGAGKGCINMIYITISTGIGAGLILNNAIYRGTYGAAGELGHVVMTENPNMCGCGHFGCIEAVASGTGMAKLAKVMIVGGQKSLILALAGSVENITSEYIYQAYLQGDPVAIAVFDNFADYLGKFFYNLYQIFNVGTIIYGGGVTKIGADLMDKVFASFLKYTPIASTYPVTFTKAVLGDEVGIYGAGLLV